MGNLGSGELLVIFFVALIVLGPNKLPEAARQVGRAVNEIRRISGGFQREMREAMMEPLASVDEFKRAATEPFGPTTTGSGPVKPAQNSAREKASDAAREAPTSHGDDGHSGAGESDA
ncbi:MAG: twin-arginine translocase TatA/TatE family subunit [Acidimicrobiales bacterium]|nr:twin-arginine translocase TatA/TatE family subunit [Acidimicrobiales bacterium]MDG1877935.1 twin-arginine translocase TatA/TatE family subunit [Acidimicrobiales bacterium]